MTAGPHTDYRDVVAALRALPGVAEADVQPDGQGGLGVLRLGLHPGVDEVEIATVVGHLLRERFHLGIDADRVEILEDADREQGHEPDREPDREPGRVDAGQVDLATETDLAAEAGSPAGSDLGPDGDLRADGDLGADTLVAERGTSVVALVPPQTLRPTIRRVQLVSSGLDVTAEVSLASGHRVVTGEARGAATPSGGQRAVAQATLRAVEELLDGAVRCELDHLDVSAVGSDRTVIVTVTMVSARGAERLTGAVIVREDVQQAVVRATLDALNRRLESLLA